ncbi:MAG: GLPGLI family protein [Sediminibacterium sp.]|nr:GLPGLI family protein [Sediminibacterium sp.]
MITKHQLLVLLLCFIMIQSRAQISSGKITYERKTNLYKKFKDNDVKEWIKEADKIKTDFFELYFTDTFSLFKLQESDLKESYSWATSKNTVYQNFKTGKRYIVKTIWSEELHMTDTLKTIRWQITESSRKIAGYNCRKAIWKVNDTTKIYAWFSQELEPSTGPESFLGLPGTILGLATEDGGVVYFAKKVEILKPEAKLFELPKKKKVYTIKELKDQVEKQYGREKWGKRMINENFGPVW